MTTAETQTSIVQNALSAVPLRSPDNVMRLDCLGASFPTRLSFLRSLLRALFRDGWRVTRTNWSINNAGVGHAVYTADGTSGGRKQTYSLVAFAHDLPDHMRSDRVIATAWDATFTLFDGVPSDADILRLAANVPLQEAGRVGPTELVLSRANRSVRLWDHVVTCLSTGTQPDTRDIDAVGYLMRTTAVYGHGKFGAADRAAIVDRPVMNRPFHLEMLTVWLIRAFSLDLVEHLARAKAPNTAVTLDPNIRRRFGIGNSTGLGMAPFLVKHPTLINAWMTARETALARVRALPNATDETRAAFATALAEAQAHAHDWHCDDETYSTRIADLRIDLNAIAARWRSRDDAEPQPWDRLFRWAQQTLSRDGQEQLVALLIEPHGDLVDALEETMSADEDASFAIDGAATVADVRQQIRDSFGWATSISFADARASQRFWYVSEEKLEPRLGERFDEPGAALEMPLATARDVASLAHDLDGADEAMTVADFLDAHPEHRHVLRRVQMSELHPYSEVRDNLVSGDMAPIDLLRCKLAFFGATAFDPRSDRWLRIAMFRDAPEPHDLQPLQDQPADAKLVDGLTSATAP